MSSPAEIAEERLIQQEALEKTLEVLDGLEVLVANWTWGEGRTLDEMVELTGLDREELKQITLTIASIYHAFYADEG